MRSIGVEKRQRGELPGNKYWPRFLLFGVAMFALGSQSAMSQCDLYVDDDTCPSEGSGTSQSPYCSIQKAIEEAADGDVICVRGGTYGEYEPYTGVELPCSNPSDCCDSQAGTCKGVHLKAENLNDRPIITEPGNVDTGMFIGTVYYAWGGTQPIVEGFIIENNSNRGIFCENASPTIRDCIIRNNSAVVGGGMYVRDCSVVSERNLFSENVATGNEETFGDGGAVYAEDSSTIMIDNVFCRNFADNAGGGMFLQDTNSSISLCNFEKNTTNGSGGAFAANGATDTAISRSVFRLNTADFGGGAIMAPVNPYAEASPESCGPVDPCEREVDIEISVDNSLFTRNSTVDLDGGAVFIGGGRMAFSNCTFTENATPDNGGAIYVFSACALVNNSILWSDEAAAGPEISVHQCGAVEIGYSDVQGGEGAIDISNPHHITYGAENIESDPLFCRPQRFEYHVATDSPVIDEGNNADVVGDYDLDGDTRIVNSVVDMGCYEYQGEEDPCEVHTGLTRACPCPAAAIESEVPADGTRDARQPHPPSDSDLDARQGIGSRNSYTGGPEPIVITLDQSLNGAEDPLCWSLCETGIESIEQGSQTLYDNFIDSVNETSPGVYSILLDRPISAKHWTTITYEGDDGHVTYSSLPANVDGGISSNPSDITFLIDILNGVRQPPYGLYSCDVDHSGACGSVDIGRVIDLLNGAGKFVPWLNVYMVANTCPDGQSAMIASGDDAWGDVEWDASAFMSATVDLLAKLEPSDELDETGLKELVDKLTDFTIQMLGFDEQKTLADWLEAPSLLFASDIVADMVPDIVSTLRNSD